MKIRRKHSIGLVNATALASAFTPAHPDRVIKSVWSGDKGVQSVPVGVPVVDATGKYHHSGPDRLARLMSGLVAAPTARRGDGSSRKCAYVRLSSLQQARGTCRCNFIYARTNASRPATLIKGELSWPIGKPPKTAADFDPEVLGLFDKFVHGDIDRRTFLERAGRYAVGGMTALGLLEALVPNFARRRASSRERPADKGPVGRIPVSSGIREGTRVPRQARAHPGKAADHSRRPRESRSQPTHPGHRPAPRGRQLHCVRA